MSSAKATKKTRKMVMYIYKGIRNYFNFASVVSLMFLVAYALNYTKTASVLGVAVIGVAMILLIRALFLGIDYLRNTYDEEKEKFKVRMRIPKRKIMR